VAISEDRHARITIKCSETILHLEAGYIFAGCFSATQFFLHPGGGPYMFANQHENPFAVRIASTGLFPSLPPNTHSGQSAASNLFLWDGPPNYEK
jgi:hypothetical protein